jgi:hypothetical protein
LEVLAVVLPTRIMPVRTAWGRWLKSMNDMANNSPPKIASTRFLPRNGISTRYPAINPPGMLEKLWMSC